MAQTPLTSEGAWTRGPLHRVAGRFLALAAQRQPHCTASRQRYTGKAALREALSASGNAKFLRAGKRSRLRAKSVTETV